MVAASQPAISKQLFIVQTSPYTNGDLFCFESVTSLLLPSSIITAAIYGFLVVYLAVKIGYLLKKNPSALTSSQPLHLFNLLLVLASLALTLSTLYLQDTCHSVDDWY